MAPYANSGFEKKGTKPWSFNEYHPGRLDTQFILTFSLGIWKVWSARSTNHILVVSGCNKVANVSYLSKYELWHSFGIRLLFYPPWKASSVRKFRCSPPSNGTLSKLCQVSQVPLRLDLSYWHSTSSFVGNYRIQSRPCPLQKTPGSIQF